MHLTESLILYVSANQKSSLKIVYTMQVEYLLLLHKNRRNFQKHFIPACQTKIFMEIVRSLAFVYAKINVCECDIRLVQTC